MNNEKKNKHRKYKIFNKKDSKNKDKKKIEISSETDLYNLSLDTINTTKIYNFYGKYFDKIYSKAIEIEKSCDNITPLPPITKRPEKKILITIKRIYIAKKKNPIKLRKKIFRKENNRYGQGDLDLITVNNNSNKSYLDNNLKKNKKNIINKSLCINKNNSKLKNKINNINLHNNNDKYLNNIIYIKDNMNNNILTSDLCASAVISSFPVLREFKIKTIYFEIKYDTIMGESLGVIGSLNELGLWKQNKALKMKWNIGNIWTATLNLNNYNNLIDFEYKFIVISNNHIKCWEEGNNRKFIVSQITGLIEQYIDGYVNEKKDIISINNMNQTFKFDVNNSDLSIICSWNIK